jgi:hypothetical protein
MNRSGYRLYSVVGTVMSCVEPLGLANRWLANDFVSAFYYNVLCCRFSVLSNLSLNLCGAA